MRIETGPVAGFPHRSRVNRADFNGTMGVGIATGEDPIATNPQCGIYWSHDGGVTWSNPVLREIGRQALGDRQITARRMGIAGVHGIRFRLDVSDPVPFSWMGGDVSAEFRR